MDCKKAEDIARQVVSWGIVLTLFLAINGFLIAASLEQGTWWLAHAIVGGIVGGVISVALICSWLSGQISICRRK